MSALPNGDNAIPHSDGAPIFGDIRPDAADLADLPELNVEDEKPDEPDASLIEKRKRKPGAEQYEKKARNLFRFAFLNAVRHPATVPDAATVLMYGPDVAEAFGDLAAENEWVKRAIDMMNETTDNAALAMFIATVPFIMQLIRNHEPAVEAEPKGIRIPFIKRTVRIKFNLKLKRFRAMTHEPAAITNYVFANPKVQEKLVKQGIIIRAQ